MLLWILYILTEAVIQAKLIESGWKPNYLHLFFIRGLFSLFHAFPILNVTTLSELSILIGFQACIFWILFDLTLNKLRDKAWDYKGKTSGWLDSIAYKYYYPLKVLAFIGIFVFYILGLNYFPF